MSAPEEHGLAGQVAIVTGGGRGLGRAMTLGLAQAGVRVIATAARELAEVEAVAKEAERECGDDRVRPLLADLIVRAHITDVRTGQLKAAGQGVYLPVWGRGTATIRLAPR